MMIHDCDHLQFFVLMGQSLRLACFGVDAYYSECIIVVAVMMLDVGIMDDSVLCDLLAFIDANCSHH